MFLWKRKLIGYCLIFYRIGESFSITDARIYSTKNALFSKTGRHSLFISTLNPRP